MNVKPNNFFSSTVFKYLVSALCGILVFIFISYMWNNYGPTIALICLGGIVVTIFLIIAILLLYRVIRIHRKERLNNEVEENAHKEELNANVMELKNKLTDALMELKKSNINIYDLPWFLLIGEPQSGKTTTLKKSGLQFPVGKEKLSGGVGTRNCDWWFTNESVILDTAGRFTMPVESAPDREEWQRFLKMLAKTRPRCPINGVIVTIPATSLLEDCEETIKQQAKQIRAKLDELVDELGITFPVHIMISKLDLVYGFREFCSNLSPLENTQILGWNQPALTKQKFDSSEFKTLFNNQCRRIYEWALRTLKSFPIGQQAKCIYSFPFEFQKLEKPLRLYLENIFIDDTYRPLVWRGCFFSSGIQTGKAFQKILAGRDQSLVEKIMGSVKNTRPFFILNFYKKVFLENGLIRQTGRSRQIETQRQLIAGIVGLILIIGAGFFLVPGYYKIKDTLKPVNDNVRIARRSLKKTCLNDKETFSLIQELDHNYSSIQHISNKRFFRTQNSIAQDLITIKDALSVKCLFKPIIEISLRKLDGSKPETEKEKNRLVDDIQTYFRIMSETKTDLPPSVRNQWQQKEILDRLWMRYIENNKISQVLPDSLTTIRKLRQGILSVNKYWDFYPSRYCDDVHNNLKNASDAYKSILNLDQNDDIKSLKEKIYTFKTVSRSIGNQTKYQVIIPPEQFQSQCNHDFNELNTAIFIDETSSAENDDLKKLQNLIQKRQQICSSEQNIYNCKNSQLSYGYMLHKNQSGQFEKDLINENLAMAVTYQPSLTPDQDKKLNTSHDALSLIIKWNEEWGRQKSDIETAISQNLKALSAGWQSKQLIQIIRQYLDLMLWDITKDAVNKAKVVLNNQYKLTSKRLRKSKDAPPIAAQASSLLQYYGTLTGLSGFLNKQNKLNGDLQKFEDDVHRSIVDSYTDCLKYWSRTMRSHDPAFGAIKKSDWSSFKNYVIHKKAKFINVNNWPLKQFLSHFSFESQQELYERVMAILKNDKSAVGMERQIETLKNTASIYQEQLSDIENIQLNFLNQIKQIPDQVNGRTDNYNINVCHTSVDTGNENSLANDLYVIRLMEIENYANSLLSDQISAANKNMWTSFNQSFQNCLNSCQKYPFPFSSIQSTVLNRGRIQTITFETITTQLIHDFLFAPNGLLSISDQYTHLKTILPSVYRLTPQEESFIEDCLAWKSFLFDKDGNPINYTITFEVLKTNIKNRNAIGKMFTEIRIWTSPKHMLRLRTVGNIKNKRGDIKWNIGLHPKITIRAINDADDGNFSKIYVIGGDIVFPAFVLNSAHKPSNRTDNSWELELLLPDGDNQFVKCKLLMNWKNEIPDRITLP